MPLHSIPTPWFPHNSPQVPGCPNHPLLLTIPILCLLRCLTLPPTQIISGPPPPGDPLNGPWGPPWATWVNPPVEGHPAADPPEDGAQQWTTSPPSAETGTTTITTTMPGPCPKLKIHRTIPATHWPGRFEWEAYKTGWNYNTLRFTLPCALPQQIKDVLHLAPKQTTYNGYKVVVTQVDQHYWEDCSKNTVPQTPWNASGNTNWQAGATNGIQSSIPANPTNPAPRFSLGQGITGTNPPLGQRLPAQLNATNLHETLEPLDTNANDHDNIPDPTHDQEALCANRIQDSPWIDMPEEMQEKRWKEGMCILCGEQGHFIRSCPKQQVMGCAVWMINREDYHRPDPDVFSAPATLLHAMILAPDNPSVHLPSHSSTNLLCTTLPFTANPIPTLVNSGTTDNFINEFLAVLTPHPL
ncbi:hypothetical protein E4T56_gene13043 [Termitomyces sp. T112]|nr:hypothetical protein E4T56_gene13043 [Termitomyces sp. T112]